MMPREQHTKLALRIQLRFEKYEPSENREVKKRKIDLKDKFLVFSWLANKMWFLINFIKIIQKKKHQNTKSLYASIHIVIKRKH